MSALVPSYGWAGTVEEFLRVDPAAWKAALGNFLLGSLGFNPAGTQSVAWDEEFEAMQKALAACSSESSSWHIIFEFELPLEGGRRPDVIVHTGDVIFVIEFKTAHEPRQPHIDQVRAYALDLGSYHQASHGRTLVPVVAISGAEHYRQQVDEVHLVSFDRIHEVLGECHGDGSGIDLQQWLNAPYAPLPTLVAAAKRIFNHEEVPNVFTAESAGIPQTLELVNQLAHEAKAKGEKKLILITGVPGSGKTLVGLRMVYERSVGEEPATFLSGNGPLVKVLQEVLKSRAFVRDLHNFIKTYGLSEKVPLEHVIVFDEAQRAWDRAYMMKKRGVPHSEPELLVHIGIKLPGWAVLIGLVGEGQEIFSGEEAGMAQWRDAVLGGGRGWKVHVSPDLADTFEGLQVQVNSELNLTVSLRSRRAADLHEWVRLVVEGSVSLAARLAPRIHSAGFAMYLTRDLNHAKSYARARYGDASEKRYGLIAPSGTKKSMLLEYNIDNTFFGDQKMQSKVSKWYTLLDSEPWSSNNLEQAATEFYCQGLELDMPIVCWNDDKLWDGKAWDRHPPPRQHRLSDPERIQKNVYRVLLTRGRDGFIIFVPPQSKFDLTEQALLAAGVRPLPELLEMVAEA